MLPKMIDSTILWHPVAQPSGLKNIHENYKSDY